VFKANRVYLVVFYLLMATVLVLSLLPIDHPDASPNDKVNHLIAYFSLGISGYFAYRQIGLMALIVCSFGVLVEFLQGLTSYRMFSVADMAANSAGVLLACASISLAKIILRTRQET